MLPQVILRNLTKSITARRFLGNGFAIIIQDERLIEKAIGVSKNLFNREQQTYFHGQNKIQNVALCYTPLLKRMFYYTGFGLIDQIILVRPDKYVAASFSDENQSTILDNLGKF